MRLVLAVSLLALATFHAAADEKLNFECKDAFATDTSHEKLEEAFGADNVVFGEIWFDEGTIPPATVIFPTVPAKRLSILWLDDDVRNSANIAFIGEDSQWTVGGLRVGMTIDEVEALNGAPFMLGGFNDMERGVVESWGDGKLPSMTGGCRIRVEFGYGHLGVPLSLNDPLNSEGPYSSENPAYGALGAKISSITIFYPDGE